ncbi:MAG: methylenetetrahydrofolate--tRNA-(uracil(54)-C(5))-methyltransferase (FADH(2)-oxidizing) TrmFO [Candidatus Eremiobacteraeota bacterium]|nr:methylenetetrahydrofolate--tRNA-(uracil(54)-C(5))-methyltransferase (FADH(2)-oxidizing) TrmFO [Candidatus Eremiobacteraeota bacterium]
MLSPSKHDNQRLAVIGGGLAGCEAAWQAARMGVDVDLYEMRPGRSGPAHKTGNLAELVCSNSLRGAALENAVGLLKEELARLDSIIVRSARESAVPAGGALAVDRDLFARAVQARIEAEPRITLHREEVSALPPEHTTIVACGPLPSSALLEHIDSLLGGGRLHYFDAASPIVSADSIDETPMYRKSRYEKGEGDDYVNIPLDREQYARLLHDLRTLPRHEPKEFEAESASNGSAQTKYFEGCLPIEEMADRGDDVLRFGPMKPVGLRDPRTGKTPHAVVQLRKETADGTAFNLVGFQTRLTWPAQKEAFGRLPGLADAEWLRLGVMHRNTFIDAPRLLDERLRLRGDHPVYFAGQITGAEGYVEAAACGAMAGIHAARAIRDLDAISFPRETAFGAVVAHLQNTTTADFQPANVTWAPFPPLETEVRDKKLRRRAMAERSLAALDRFIAETIKVVKRDVVARAMLI